MASWLIKTNLIGRLALRPPSKTFSRRVSKQKGREPWEARALFCLGFALGTYFTFIATRICSLVTGPWATSTSLRAFGTA
jgi:hypothetical protein